jgi:hypothetical protein
VWWANPFAAASSSCRRTCAARRGPGDPPPRAAAATLALLALAPLALALTSVAGQLGYGVSDAAWGLVLVLAGGHAGPLAWLTWSVLGGVAVAVGMLIARTPAPEPVPAAGPAVRGPRTYAGPGSLGGTDSAMRR